ncbi:MAG: hypothetical protein CVU56_26840 [Deltaproteobacteria bacterium HGW-Deltaproteobacteria-14]|jgi:hypothetical protein|nr:MAG: hypothetical protein CVU56_26840 [Deltaproteobacteria bacterium HGW-Deltaproteobacteria-14]
MRVYFTTVVRGAPLERGGELIALDWSTRRVAARTPIVPPPPSVRHDPNARGNARGGRGIALADGRVYVCSYHTLHELDAELAPLHTITAAQLAGLHEVADAGGGGLWIAATAVDAAVRVHLGRGEVDELLSPRDLPALQTALGVEAFPHDRDADLRTAFLDQGHLKSTSHLHLNAVLAVRGRVLGLLHAFGAIADLRTGEVLARDPRLRGAHNLVALEDDLVAVNDTVRGAVLFVSLTTGRVVRQIALRAFPWVRRHARRAAIATFVGKVRHRLRLGAPVYGRPLFVRGLAHAGDLLMVGVAPSAVLALDWRTGALRGAYRHSADPNSAIHGLAVSG